MDRDTLLQLRSRVREATGANDFTPKKMSFADLCYWADAISDHPRTLDTLQNALRGSLDAALSLVERVLGWSWRVGNLPSGRAFCVLGTSRVEHIAATPALAVVLALLETLIDSTPEEAERSPHGG